MWSRFRGLLNKRLLWRVGLVFVAWLWCVGAVYAATYVNISGTIRAEPRCELNNNQTIYVDFGVVRIESIDGKNYKRDVNFSISCKNMQANTVKLQIQGSASTDNPSALLTNIKGMGVMFLVDGSPVSPNTWFNVDYLKLPAVTVVPVKWVDAPSLLGTSFNVQAALLVSYL